MSKEKQIIEIKECIDAVYGADCAYFDVDGFAIANEIYNAGYRKQEWISVDEALPERNGRYLTHCNIEGQSLVCILHYCKVGEFNEGTITHWMPLPDAPKMKGGAE